MKKSYPFYEKLVLLLALVLGYSFQADAQSSSLNETASLNPTSVYASFSINANNQCLVGNRYVMANNSSSGTYAWDFGDGTTSTEANPSHVYTQAGNFRIHLDVRNGNDYAFSEVFINVMPKPNVDFKILNGTLNGKSFTFISTSTIQSGSMYYWWNLGDGNTSTLVNPTETYATSGNYHVTLIVTSDYGCKDSIQKTVTFNTNYDVPSL
jgi:PKD repeat protein